MRTLKNFPFLVTVIVTLSVALYAFGVQAPLDGASTGWDRFAGVATSMVSHGSLGHLVSNVVTLVVFGTIVEMAYGTRWVLAVTAAVAAFAWFTIEPGRQVLGASGVALALVAFAVVAVVRHAVDAVGFRDGWRTWCAVPAAFGGTVMLVFQLAHDVSNLGDPVRMGPNAVVGHDLHLWAAALGAAVALPVSVIALPRLWREWRGAYRF